jgi:hypothetical protein
LSGKYVQIARDLDSSHPAVDYLWHTDWPDGKRRYEATLRVADAQNLKLRSRGIGDVTELNGAIVSMKESGAIDIIVQPSPFTYRHRTHIIDTALDRAMGTVFAFTVA